ncbi:MAG: hypothetical protein JRH06_16405 [Deltaproteobacteria bacterium]|nr:hypothetical protein [Deltaproteobacteria bacterium]MBW2139119.1 hypothetical protein [Deltaproteobacteria bacterium]
MTRLSAAKDPHNCPRKVKPVLFGHNAGEALEVGAACCTLQSHDMVLNAYRIGSG